MIRILYAKRRLICAILLITVLQSIFAPIAIALTTGPEQVEYSSYESADASDLVNLITGDFSYTMPVVEVPGPEGTFTVPLFYHGGITPEQDASWTGLGFNLNVGCVSRDIVGYPDDAYDQSIAVNVNDPGGSGWVKNYVVYKRTWDSQKGFGAGISLFDIVGADWDNSTGGLKSGTLMGLNFNKDGIKGTWGENVINVAQAVIALYSLGSSALESGASKVEMSAMDVMSEGVSIGASLYQGYKSEGKFSSKYANWDVTQQVSNLGFRVDYKYWLDDTRTEKSFGSLYLGSTHKASISSPIPAGPNFNGTDVYWPRINTPSLPIQNMPVVTGFKKDGSTYATSDMYTYIGPNENYANVTRSSNISYDQFQVMSDGISGTISPYRLEIGTLSQPKRYTYWNSEFNIVPFLEEDNNVNKVQFAYKGQYANNYSYHDDTDFGVTASLNTFNNKKYLFYDISNTKLTNARVENDNARIKDKKILSGKNIEWFSNEEINSGVARGKGFIDYGGIVRDGFYPSKSIGGFSITREDGLTYHYALPINKTQENYFIGLKGQEKVKYSKSYDDNVVAISWLLTGITGPDFVDRGQLGLLDDLDWGYWMKFDYGNTTNFHSYRHPYYGYIDDGVNISYASGLRQEYYLNSIESKSHIAIFIKGLRTDGLSSYFKKIDPSSGNPEEVADGETDKPAQPMYLDEIALLKKSDFQNLSGIGFSKGDNVADQYHGAVNTLNVYDLADVSRNSNYRSFLDSKSLRRVKFVYETDESKKLCKKTLNSFVDINNPPPSDAADIYAGKLGKLTLRRVQFYGKNSAKVIPDYLFDYNYNPDYNKDTWDGWGYYNPNGTSSMDSHTASQVDQHGTAWSLSRLTLPTGSEIDIDFERDSYSSISGQYAWGDKIPYSKSNYDLTFPNSGMQDVYVPDPTVFHVGDKIRISSGKVNYSCIGTAIIDPLYYQSDNLTVQSVGSNSINVGVNYMGSFNCIFSGPGAVVHVTNNSGMIQKAISKKGGDIRVSLLSFKNEFGDIIKTKYSYLNLDNSSSGVVSKEPDFIKSGDNNGLDMVYDYPSTSVLYSRVIVQNGYNKLSDTYSTKQVYEFVTPDRSFVTEASIQLNDAPLPGFVYITTAQGKTPAVNFKQYFNKVDIRNSRIGKIKSVTTYDNNDVFAESLDFDYIENTPNNQGKYTTGSMLADFTTTGNYDDTYVMRFLRTVKTYYPYELSNITYSKDGYTQTKSYKSWDLFTGIPLVTENKSSMGYNTREQNIPAYTVYPEMGLKGLNVNNKNMLSQIASSYTYALDGSRNVLGLIDATTTTWKKDWSNYRIAQSGTYTNSPDINDLNNDGSITPSEISAQQIWRKFESNVWMGNYSRLNAFGLQNFSESDKFNFSSSNPLWKKVGSFERFNHNSQILESKDMNGMYASSKYGYDEFLPIASSVNSRYEEIAFSGAEDKLASNPLFFGGEVALGAGTVVTTPVHTGTSSLSVSTGYGFIFKTAGILPNKNYRASVWTSSSSNGRIYYIINGGTEVLPTPTISQSIVLPNGSVWYRLDVAIPIGNIVSPSIEVGVKSTNGTVYFDDFRFQPSDAAMTCNVYNPNTFNIEYILDNDNLYIRYEYNDIGLLTKTYGESLKTGQTGEKLMSESKNDFRRFHID